MSTASTLATVDPYAATPSGVAVPVHPTYATWANVWRKLLHVYEGSGGFLDGTYLIAHPREWKDFTAESPQTPTKKLENRRKLARYENVAATILDQKKAALFRENISRTIGGKARKDAEHPLTDWWANVDGNGCDISDWMAEAFTPAALFGFVIHVMDRPQGPTPQTKADEQWPYLRLYSPLDMPDWLTNDRGVLTAVKLLEAVQRESLDEAPATAANYQERHLTATGWKVIRKGGGFFSRIMGPTQEFGDHNFGKLPVVLHYAKRRAMTPIIGASVLNDPQLFIDLYNLTSEIRELLRAQTFGLLNVVLGTGDQATSIETALSMLGNEKGVENVVFSPAEARYLQPDTGNVEVYQKERNELLRTIYRLCAVPWEADSKDAEAEGSLKLKREDMNQVLASYADECEKAEYEIARLWFRTTHGKAWQREWDAAEVVIRYPDTFDVTPFAEILEQAQAAVALEMPAEFMAELKKRLVQKFIPDASPELVGRIEKAIDTAAKEAAETGGPGAIERARKVLRQYGAEPERLAA